MTNNFKITITDHTKLKRVVSARELYEFLEIQTAFTHWIDRMIDYGFEENTDYIVYVKNDINLKPLGGRPSVDYLMTVDAARELYEFLEIDTRFNDWIIRNIDYLDFQENINYIVFLKNEVNSEKRRGKPSVDYFYTIDAAKEISMLQRSDY
jgi:phage anti-repressor protein